MRLVDEPAQNFEIPVRKNSLLVTGCVFEENLELKRSNDSGFLTYLNEGVLFGRKLFYRALD